MEIFLGFDVTRFRSCQVIITPKAGKGSGMVAKARELAEKHGWFLGWSSFFFKISFCTYLITYKYIMVFFSDGWFFTVKFYSNFMQFHVFFLRCWKTRTL